MSTADLFITGDYVPHFRPEDRSNPFRFIYRRKLEDTLHLLGEVSGRRILDAGGGMGRLSLPLAGAGARTVLLDLSAAMLAEARRRAGDSAARPQMLVGNAMHLPFADGAFDALVALDLFCHLPDPRAGLAELKRVIRPGGRIVIDSTSSNPLWVLFYPRYAGLSPRKWAGALAHGGVLPGWTGRVHHYPEARFHALVDEAGFERLERRAYGPSLCPKWHLVMARRP